MMEIIVTLQSAGFEVPSCLHSALTCAVLHCVVCWLNMIYLVHRRRLYVGSHFVIICIEKLFSSKIAVSLTFC